MAMKEFKTSGFVSGVQNKLPTEKIAQDAASTSLGWITEDGNIFLSYGRQLVGSDGPQGGIFGEIFAPKKDGTRVHFRKANTKIQYFNGTTWVDVITGLTAGSNYTFAPYISLAGAYVYCFGPDGLYKIATANPGSYKDMFDEAKNYKGFAIINQQRTILWNRSNGNVDKMGLYLSKIDPQGTNYSTVTNEVVGTGDGTTTTFTGTLAQATGKRFVFGCTLSMSDASITGNDSYVGTITGTGVTGTINYATGAYSLTFTTAPTNAVSVQLSYQYEDSNTGGVTDFTFSSPRQAAEGDIISQEYLGEPIQNVIVFEGKYYSMKKTSVYELDLTNNDTNATNLVYRVDIGIPSMRSAISTGKGIVYMDTANPSKPMLSILQRNQIGNALEPVNLTPLFRWEDYDLDDCVLDTYGENIIVSAKTRGSDGNDIMFLINTQQKYSVDILPYGANTFVKEGGSLYAGDSFSDTVYEVLSGYDDLGQVVPNQWTGKDESYGDDILKHFRYFKAKGFIDPNQVVQIYVSYENGDFQLIGTLRGDASYVDINDPQVIGGGEIGDETLGGGNQTTVYPYYMQFRVRTPKFRTRKFKYVAIGIGYVSIESQTDFDILTFDQRMPRRFRQKQHVSLDGTQTNQNNFAN